MRNIFLALIGLTVLTACYKAQQNASEMPCAPKFCTLEAAAIVVKFVDRNGQPLVVNNYKAVNMRTGLDIKYAGPFGLIYFPGQYYVATDGDLKQLSEKGDDIKVSAANPITSQTKIVTFKASGGCACHVGKISGPVEVTFD